jgi:hypothetical protein
MRTLGLALLAACAILGAGRRRLDLLAEPNMSFE